MRLGVADGIRTRDSAVTTRGLDLLATATPKRTRRSVVSEEGGGVHDERDCSAQKVVGDF